MKLFYTLIIFIAASCWSSLSAQGFNESADFWSVPSGGQIDNGLNQGFITPSDFFADGEDDESLLWSTMDMTGDGRLDLVVTAKKNGQFATVGNLGGSWQVYENTGSGFANAPTLWSLPAGGQIMNGTNYGFYTVSDLVEFGEDDNSVIWTTTDMDGDNRPDLVVTSTYLQGNSTLANNGGVWKVYANNGSGFDSSPILWTVPSGGLESINTVFGFNKPTQQFFSGIEIDGSQLWDLQDMDGDSKPDLVVTSEKVGPNPLVLNSGGPIWQVYKNNGTGFDVAATLWPIPDGGRVLGGADLGYVAIVDYNPMASDGSEAWSFFDINGDDRPDLVVTAEVQNSMFVIANNGSDVWQVYLNNGSGFDLAPTFWTLPTGGQISSNEGDGFVYIFNASNFNDETGSQLFGLSDLNADGRPDLVVTSELSSGGEDEVLDNNGPVWRVYFNNGSGFDVSPVFWNLPAGGQVSNGNGNGFIYLNDAGTTNELDGSDVWYLLDMDGDEGLDLVVPSELTSGELAVLNNSGPVWRVYKNDQSNPGTGLIDRDLKLDLSVYPNPIDDGFTIAIPAGGTSLVVRDVLGRNILRAAVQTNKFVETANWSAGLYFIDVFDASGRVIASAKISLK